ncbi:hypothetical protein PoB_005876500 [Plakobranchus ocellatus]|uniref:Uncharacterized protein n=1 Tax=Plakobranchus ocellatus TaxID=259542 RepID=A0AAV4CHB3_9GAST|nr:hypothetical protein PoB_005876500 [Plakobranchus ocellatus]
MLPELATWNGDLALSNRGNSSLSPPPRACLRSLKPSALVVQQHGRVKSSRQYSTKRSRILDLLMIAESSDMILKRQHENAWILFCHIGDIGFDLGMTALSPTAPVVPKVPVCLKHSSSAYQYKKAVVCRQTNYNLQRF